MSKEKRVDGSRKKGGSESARESGLRGIVIHLTPEEYDDVRIAAARSRQPIKHFARDATLAATRKKNSESSPDPS